MSQDDDLLNDIPEFFSVDTLMKARPSEENGRRFIYFEASNENVDQDGEMVLAKALEDSAQHFLKFGNIDIDHYTLLGKPNPTLGRAGIPNCEQYEIGSPVDVAVSGGRTFVKAELYQGDTELTRNANMVWDSMTKQVPAAKWYPSVGGAVLAKSIAIDPNTKQKVGVVSKVRWTNVALSRTPVNQHLSAAQTLPVGVFAKSLNGFVMSKSLTAGYGTDMASLTGGSALRMQSLDGTPASYYDYRDRLSGAIISREAKLQSRNGLIDYSVNKFSLSADEANEWVDRFLTDLKRRLN